MQYWRAEELESQRHETTSFMSTVYLDARDDRKLLDYVAFAMQIRNPQQL